MTPTTEAPSLTTAVEVQVSSEDYQELIDNLIPAFAGYSRAHGIAACLTLALVIMNPDISAEELRDGVRGVSQWLAQFVETSVQAATIEGAQANKVVLAN